MIMHNVNVTKSKENVPDEKIAQWSRIIFEGSVSLSLGGKAKPRLAIPEQATLWVFDKQ